MANQEDKNPPNDEELEREVERQRPPPRDLFTREDIDKILREKVMLEK